MSLRASLLLSISDEYATSRGQEPLTEGRAVGVRVQRSRRGQVTIRNDHCDYEHLIGTSFRDYSINSFIV